MDLLRQWDTTWLVDKFIVVKNRFIPWDIKELKNTPHPLTRMQDKLLIVHHEATWGSHITALVIHSLNRWVPFRQTLAIACQIKPCDSHLHNQCQVKCNFQHSGILIQRYKVKLFLSLPWRHVGGSRSIAQCNMNLSAKRRWVVNLMPRPLYSQQEPQ